MKKLILKTLSIAATTTLVVACSNVKFDLPPTSEKFDQKIAYNNKVDIIWIVDNSTSMLKHQKNLSAQIPDLVQKLNTLKMDYHIAVITTSIGGDHPDGGKLIGSPKFLTATTPDLESSLKNRMIVGEVGSNRERGLESLYNVLSPAYVNNEGVGFLREDALLVIIALSDEDDKSAVSNPFKYYSEFLDKIKQPWVDGSRSWVFNFIGVLPSSVNCRTFNDYAEAGLIFIDMVNFSGGVKESICSTNFSTAVSNIRSRIYQILTDFKLAKKPVIESIVVTIDGQSIPRDSTNGWDYVEPLNAIRFYGAAVPAADADIKIDFKPKEAN